MAEPTTYIQMMDLVHAAGKKLAANLTAGYVEGYERTLADGLMAEADGLAEDVLWQMCHDHLDALISVDCLLGECDEGSYETVKALTDTLVAEIRRQDGERDAVRRLVTDAIHVAARTELTTASLRAGGA